MKNNNNLTQKSSLCERFSETMKCSITDYLTFVRITEAKKLLKTTSFGMDKIASVCGFSSANYFSLIFKKQVGLF